MKTYQAINCEFHDVIESYATRREAVDLVVVRPAEVNRTIRTVVCDVYSRNVAFIKQGFFIHPNRLD
jgi:hypothetical protein